VRKDMLAYVINEWDNYAIEEAIQIKEKLGGTVTALTIEDEDDEKSCDDVCPSWSGQRFPIDSGNLAMDPLSSPRSWHNSSKVSPRSRFYRSSER